VSILKSKSGDIFYIGSTSDIERRFGEHNRSKVSSTKRYQPWELKCFLPCKNRQESRNFEERLKKYKNKGILQKVIESGIFPWEYAKN